MELTVFFGPILCYLFFNGIFIWVLTNALLKGKIKLNIGPEYYREDEPLQFWFSFILCLIILIGGNWYYGSSVFSLFNIYF